MRLRNLILSGMAGAVFATTQVFGQKNILHHAIDYEKIKPGHPENTVYVQSLRDSVAANPRYLFYNKFPSWFDLERRDGAEVIASFDPGVHETIFDYGVWVKDSLIHHPSVTLYSKRTFHDPENSTISYTLEKQQSFIDRWDDDGKKGRGLIEFTMARDERYDLNANESATERVRIRKHYNQSGEDIILNEHELELQRYSYGTGLNTVFRVYTTHLLPSGTSSLGYGEYPNEDDLFYVTRSLLFNTFHANHEDAVTADTQRYQGLPVPNKPSLTAKAEANINAWPK